MTMSEAGKLGYQASKAGLELARQKRIEEYNKDPLKCQECLQIMSYEKIIKRRPSERKFCSRSCGAKYNNKMFPKRCSSQTHLRKNGIKQNKCLNCDNECYNNYCNTSCCYAYKWKLLVEEIEILQAIPTSCWQQRNARKYFLYKYGNQCSQCKLTEWNNQPIPVVLDHINGNSEDYNLSNLRLLCCNCDAQTPTYKGKNVGNGRHSRRQRYKNGLSY